MSPRAALRSTENPLPRRRNWSPVWVPGGIFTLALLPSIAGTSISPPSAAWVIRNGTRMKMFAPSRWKIGCGTDRDVHVEIAGRRALAAGLAFAGEADARAVLHARRDRHLQGALALHRAGAVADLAGIADHPALAAAGRAGPLDQEEALLCAHLAGAAAGARRCRPRAPCPPSRCRCRHRTTTRVGTRSVRLGAGEGFGQLDLDGLADVVAGAGATGATAAAAAHELAEHLVEDVAEAAAGREVEAGD